MLSCSVSRTMCTVLPSRDLAQLGVKAKGEALYSTAGTTQEVTSSSIFTSLLDIGSIIFGFFREILETRGLSVFSTQ